MGHFIKVPKVGGRFQCHTGAHKSKHSVFWVRFDSISLRFEMLFRQMFSLEIRRSDEKSTRMRNLSQVTRDGELWGGELAPPWSVQGDDGLKPNEMNDARRGFSRLQCLCRLSPSAF